MKKATLSLVILLLYASLSINGMIFDLDLNAQTHYSYNYPHQPSIISNTMNHSEVRYLSPPEIGSLFTFFGGIAFIVGRVVARHFYPRLQQHNRIVPKNNYLLWIETSDGETFSMEIKKDLPLCGLQYLLKKYSRRFGHKNNKETPLKIGCTLSDYQLINRACNAINHNIRQWNFTQRERTTLLALASSFKILNLYLALLDPSLQTNTPLITTDINKFLTSLLCKLDKEIHMPRSKIMIHATQPIKLSKEPAQPHQKSRKYSHDKKYYLKHEILYNTENDECLTKIPKHTTLTPLTKKDLLLLSNAKMNTFFIYDIKNKEKHYLPITSLEGCHKPYISPDENYIATFSKTNANGEYKESLIHIWNISDLNNVRYHKPLYHRAVCKLTFSPDSTILISGANHNNILLWKLAELSHENINPNPLLSSEKIQEIIFNKDNTTLAIKQSHSLFCRIISIINIETLHSHTITPTKQVPTSIFDNDSDLIMYSTYNEALKEYAFKIITKEGTELYSKKLEADIENSPIDSLISKNNHHIAINYLLRENCDFLTIDNQLNIKTTAIDGICDAINDDGSFYTHTPHEIRLHDAHSLHCTTLYYAPEKLLSTVKISPHKQRIKYTYHSDNQTKHKSYRQLVDEEIHKNIKEATEAMTPLQYMLLAKACDHQKKHRKAMSIFDNSLDHHALESFGQHKELITQTLNFQITDK